MLSIIKKHKYHILELIIIFTITLLYNLICANFSGDEIWNYGFAYNISSGLIPYKDFNMIITPIYPMIGALFLTVFGKSLIIYHIFHAIICTILFYNIKKIIPNNYYLAYLILLLNAYPSYNIFCMLLLYILMNQEEKNNNDYLIGIILGITFLTKQNIGILLSIPTIFIKDIKRILKRGVGFILPISILLVYLLINNNLFEFIDYTILGMSSFAKGNITINKLYLSIIIINTIYLFYQYIKTKDIKIIYILLFQVLAFPMLDYYHMMIAIIPIVGYLINKIKVNKIITITTIITFLLCSFGLNINYIYQGEFNFFNNTKVYRYRKISSELIDGIISISNYLNTIDEEIYILSQNAYIYKLESNIPINQYDLLNNGNMGKDGEDKIIKGITDNCNNKKCIFAVNLEELSLDQNEAYAQKVIEYIATNYHQTERITHLTIFKNYK